MNEELNLLCGSCSASHPPAWAAFTASNAEWLDPDAPIPAGNVWTRSDVSPQAAQLRTIRVTHPCRAAGGAPFWVLYLPARAAENGWAEAPETIPHSAFALCRLEKIVQREKASAWLSVRIDDVAKLPALVERIPAQRAALSPPGSHQTFRRAAFEHWEVLEGNTEGDVGVWVIALHAAQKVHLLVQEEWSFHEDIVCAGNVELTEEQWAAFSHEL
jgi:hypothetical protein